MTKPRDPRPLSWGLIFLAKTNVIVTGLTACTVLFTRSSGVAYFAMGAVACSLSVKLLKKVIRQPRPSRHQQKLTYGMPSTHSATISFFATYILLSCIYLPVHQSFPSKIPGFPLLLSPVVISWATAIILSRVWLGHHSWPQVGVGVSYGVAFALGWFTLWYSGLNESEYAREVEEMARGLY